MHSCTAKSVFMHIVLSVFGKQIFFSLGGLSQHKQRSADCSFPHQLTGCYCHCVSVRAGASCTTLCWLLKFLVSIFVKELLFQIFVTKSREDPGLSCFVLGAVASSGQDSSLVKSPGGSKLTPSLWPEVLPCLVSFSLFALSTGLVPGWKSWILTLSFAVVLGFAIYTTHTHASSPNYSVCQTGKIIVL